MPSFTEKCNPNNRNVQPNIMKKKTNKNDLYLLNPSYESSGDIIPIKYKERGKANEGNTCFNGKHNKGFPS